MKLNYFVVSISAFLASAGSFALPNPCNRTFDDSTCMGPRAIRNMPIPVPQVITKDQICGLIDCTTPSGTPTTLNGTGIPAGYREITTATGPHFGTDSDISYYPSIGYSVITMPRIASISRDVVYNTNNVLVACGNDINNKRIIYYPSQVGDNDNSNFDGIRFPSKTIVCEPVGTRTTMLKNTLGQTKIFTLADINPFAISGTIGVVAAAASFICQAKGYIDVTPSSVSSWWRGSGCDQGDRITRNTATGWKTDSACYNSVLTGMQCYK